MKSSSESTLIIMQFINSFLFSRVFLDLLTIVISVGKSCTKRLVFWNIYGASGLFNRINDKSVQITVTELNMSFIRATLKSTADSFISLLIHRIIHHNHHWFKFMV